MPQEKNEASAADTVTSGDAWIEQVGKAFNVLNRPGDYTLVKSAVDQLVEELTRGTVVYSEDVGATIRGIIAGIDQKLTDQINLILHHERFQQVESAWRGLHHLVTHSELDKQLQIKVIDISKKDLGRLLKSTEGANWDQGSLFKQIYEEEYGSPGGNPYGCLVGDYHFDHSPGDIKILDQMSMIAAAAHAPFIAGANHSLFGFDSWQELPNRKDLKNLFTNPSYAGWNSLRQSDNAKYLGLAMPRFLARLPYGPKTDPVEEFNFEEDTGLGDHKAYTWANSAYAMAVNVTRSFKECGWGTRIRGKLSGGVVEQLPVHTFPSDDGGVDMKCPTEIGITDRREKELADCGLMPISHVKNTDEAYFVGAQSVQVPQKHSGPNKAYADANANLAARLPYMFASCRFAHYLKVMVREWIGKNLSREQLERDLDEWIQQYAVKDPSKLSELEQAKKPLKEAKVIVEENEADPGYYSARFLLTPHYQLEGVDVSMSLVSRLPEK